jgi:hypothetical protein
MRSASAAQQRPGSASSSALRRPASSAALAGGGGGAGTAADSSGVGAGAKLLFGTGQAHRHPLRLSTRTREAANAEEVARAAALGLVVGGRAVPESEVAASTDRLYQDAFMLKQRQALATAAKEAAFSFHPAITPQGAAHASRQVPYEVSAPTPSAARTAAADADASTALAMHKQQQPRYQMLYGNAAALVRVCVPCSVTSFPAPFSTTNRSPC